MAIESKQPLIQFIAGTTSNRYPALDGDILINASVIQAASQTSRSAAALIPRVGYELLLSITNIKWAYASNILKKQLIWVDNELRAYDLLGASPSIYTVVPITLPTTFDRPLITDTFTGVVISINGLGYSINTSLAVTPITGANWAVPSSIWFVDGYVLISVKDSRFFNYSDLNDTTFSNALLTAAMAGDTDNLSSLAIMNREVYLFGERHTELWYNSAADVNTIFTRQDGRYSSQGVISQNTVVINGVGYNVCRGDTNFGVFAWNPQATDISSDYIDQELQTATSTRMLTSFERNRLYIHVLINENRLWSYDLTSQVWSLRVYPGKQVLDIIRIEALSYLVFADGIYTMQSDTDAGTMIQSVKQTSHIYKDGYTLFHKMLEIDVGGDIAQLILQYSDDGGKTWKNTIFSTPTSIGYYSRYRFHRLGKTRDRVYRLTWMSSTAAGIYSVTEDIEIGTK